MTASDDSLEGQRLRRAIAARLFARDRVHTRVGRYRLRELLGEGGMGLVYAARDERSDGDVALKLPRSGHARFAAERLAHEARALARIRSPHVVGLLDTGDADGRPYLAMTLVHGVDLRRVALPRATTARIAVVIAIAAQIARALAAAHEVGVVHRDVKPRNIVVDRNGHATLVDFGLAAIDGALPCLPADPHATTTSSRSGTLAYMAPEQIAGAEVDARSDQYALCVTILELVRGNPLDLGPDHESTLAAVKSGRVQAAIDALPIDRRLAAVLRRGTAIAPERRFPDILALARALTRPTSKAHGPTHEPGRATPSPTVP